MKFVLATFALLINCRAHAQKPPALYAVPHLCAIATHSQYVDSLILRRTSRTLTQDQVRELRNLKARVSFLRSLPEFRKTNWPLERRKEVAEIRVEYARLAPLALRFYILEREVIEVQTLVEFSKGEIHCYERLGANCKTRGRPGGRSLPTSQNERLRVRPSRRRFDAESGIDRSPVG